MKYLPGVSILNIFVRNMRSAGKSDAEILAAMQRRLNLARFDLAALSEEDRERHRQLTEFLHKLESPQ